MISAVSAATIEYPNPGISINVSQILSYPAVIHDAGPTPPMVNYTSTNPLIASVDVNGNITGISVGSTHIEAEIVLGAETLSASVVVDVIDPSALLEVSSISVSADYSRMPYMADGQSGYYGYYDISAEVTDADGNPLPGEEVTWEVLGSSTVVSIVTGVDSKQSFIKPLGPGTAEVRARSVSNTSIVSENISITVFVPKTNNVRFDLWFDEMIEHDSSDYVSASTRYVDDMFNIKTDDTLEWLISNTSVISVEKESYGNVYESYYYVTALVPGTSTLQLKSGTNSSAVSDVYTITVFPYSPIALVWDFDYDTSKLNFTPGAYGYVGVSLNDSKGVSIDNPMTAWSSSNATVFEPLYTTSSSGTVFFKHEGTANLIAQSVYYPDLTNTTQFVVSPPEFSIETLTNVTTNSSVFLRMVNQFGDLIYGVDWSVSDPSILVDNGYSDGGYYTANPGQVTVTGKYGDYPSVSYTFTVEKASISNIYGYIPSYMGNGSSESIWVYAYNQYNRYMSRASIEWQVDNGSVLEVIPPHDSIDSMSAILRAHGVGIANLTVTDPITGVNLTQTVYVEDYMYRPVLSGISVSLSPPGHDFPTAQYASGPHSPEESMTVFSAEQLSDDAAFGPQSAATQYSFEESGPLMMSTTVLDMNPQLATGKPSVVNTIYMGYRTYVYATTYDQLGKSYEDDISWSVSDPTVVRLVQDSFNGVIVYGEKVGTITLTGTSRTNQSIFDSITLTVVPMPSVIQVTVSAHANISVSDVVTADAEVLDTDGNPIKDAVVTWSSSDPRILNITSIDGNQIMFTAENPGEASISALYEVQLGSESYLALKTSYKFNVSDYVMPLDVLALNTAWNFVSVPIPLNTTQNTAGTVFTPVNTDNHSVLEYNSSVQAWIPLKSTTKLYPITGYWIYSAVPTKVNLSLSADPLSVPPAKQLYTGWNAIGLNNNQSMEAKDMLSTVKDAWVTLIGWNLQQSEWDTSIINDGTGPYSDLRMVNTGWGYWVYVTQDIVLPGNRGSVKV